MVSHVVQSVLLKRDKFSRKEAFDWIRAHGYKADKVDMTSEYYRFRQHEPVHSVSASGNTKAQE